MANKFTVGLLAFLILIAAGFGYYAHTSHQHIELVIAELNSFQEESAERAAKLTDELLSLKAEMSSLGGEIDESAAHIADLETEIQANLETIDSLKDKIGDTEASISALEQDLAETAVHAGLTMNAPDLYRKASQIVVRISDGQQTVGSGFIYNSEGYILTANHVVDQLDEISVIFSDGSVSSVNFVGSCEVSDVAVLKINSEYEFKFALISDSDAVRIGDPVAAIGSPFDLTDSLNTGVVSQLNRFIDIEYGGQVRWVSNLIQFDAAVNSGNSGGPLFDSEGNILMRFGGPGNTPGAMVLPSTLAIDSTSIPYFKKYFHKDFNVEYLLFVANQYGSRLINIYAFGSFPEGYELSESKIKTILVYV